MIITNRDVMFTITIYIYICVHVRNQGSLEIKIGPKYICKYNHTITITNFLNFKCYSIIYKVIMLYLVLTCCYLFIFIPFMLYLKVIIVISPLDLGDMIVK